MSPVLLLSLLAPVSVVLAATYDLKVYSGGSSFFDAFTYTGTYDTAHNQPTWDAANSSWSYHLPGTAYVLMAVFRWRRLVWYIQLGASSMSQDADAVSPL